MFLKANRTLLGAKGIATRNKGHRSPKANISTQTGQLRPGARPRCSPLNPRSPVLTGVFQKSETVKRAGSSSIHGQGCRFRT